MKQHRPHSFLRRLYIAIALILANVLFGVLGFMFSFDQSVRKALYNTINILSTVGGLTSDVTHSGNWFVIVFILLSIGIFAYAVSVVTSYIMEGDLQRYLKFKRVKKEIEKLSGHVIVCGFGRNGQQACEQLRSHNQVFVAIESNPQLAFEMHEHNKDMLIIEGNATHDETLLEAGIKSAKALISTLPNDSDNVFVVLTARELNPKLKIISRASEDSSDKKLKRAGANNVIMPDKIGGTHMATLVTRPDVLEFLDFITGRINIRLEEILYSNLSDRLKGKTIRELEIRNKTGANIVGFKTSGGEYVINPEPDTVMKPDAKLFVLGTQDQVTKLLEVLSS